MEGRIPSEIVNARLKKVFGTAYQLWFTPPLMRFARELIETPDFRQRPFVDARRVQKWVRSWERAASSRRLAYQVWNLVNLELWFRLGIDGSMRV